MGRRRLAQDFVRRQLKHAGHGVHGPAKFFAAARKQRQDELGDVQLRLAHQPPQSRRLAQTTGAAGGELAGKIQAHAGSVI